MLSRWDDSMAGFSYAETYGSFWQLPIEGTSVQGTGSFHNYDSNSFMTGVTSRELADDRYFINMTGNYGLLGFSRRFRVDYVYEDPTAYMGPTLANITVNATTAGTGVGDSSATAIDISAQTMIDLILT